MPREYRDRAPDVVRSLSAVARRLRAADILRVFTAVAPFSALAFVLLRRGGASPRFSAIVAIAGVTVVAALWIARMRERWLPAAAARAIELARPASRNVVITAEELLRHPDRAIPSIRARVLHESAEIAGAPAGVVPLQQRVFVAFAAIGVAVLLVLGIPARAARAAIAAIQNVAEKSAARSAELTIAATVTPPSYTHDPPRVLQNPERIEALQGSRLTLRAEGGGGWKIRFGAEDLKATTSGTITTVDLDLVKSGYLAVEPRGGDATALRRLLPVTVIPDRAPTIRVEAPGKDLLLPDAKPVIALTAGATDDFGLQSLELRYTKVSGSGEQFEFKEGTLPLAIARPSPREWKATAELALSRIGLEPGDAMIYRVVGRDERPGDAGVASSETFFIEVAGPGQVALAGFELPPDRERYALSQQMIVLKLERLRAREKGLDRSVLEQEVGNLAAEQRAVRANFVFLMGGQIEDEEAEAEHSHEIQEGRLENTARREIIDAIQEMGKVEVGLAAINTGAALPPARAAVEALQRAFGKNRYILRTLPVRSRVDPSRRLTGELSAASDWRRELYPPAADPAVDAARTTLRKLLELAPAIKAGTATALQLTSLAEEALAIDPAVEDWQVVSRGLLQLRDGRGSAKERAETLNQAVARVAGVVDRAAMAPRTQSKDNSLRSAWAAERP